MIDHRSYTHTDPEAVVKLKPEQNSGLNDIPTYDLCDTGAVLYTVIFDDPDGR